MSIFGDRLKQIRTLRNKTQKELSDSLGISLRMLQFLEAGQREPNLDVFQKMCEVLDCSADYLLGRVEDPNGEKEILWDVFSQELDAYFEKEGIEKPAVPPSYEPSPEKIKMFETFMKMYSAEREKAKDPQ